MTKYFVECFGLHNTTGWDRALVSPSSRDHDNPQPRNTESAPLGCDTVYCQRLDKNRSYPPACRVEHFNPGASPLNRIVSSCNARLHGTITCKPKVTAIAKQSSESLREQGFEGTWNSWSFVSWKLRTRSFMPSFHLGVAVGARCTGKRIQLDASKRDVPFRCSCLFWGRPAFGRVKLEHTEFSGQITNAYNASATPTPTTVNGPQNEHSNESAVSSRSHAEAGRFSLPRKLPRKEPNYVSCAASFFAALLSAD
eukprot:g66162.t1